MCNLESSSTTHTSGLSLRMSTSHPCQVFAQQSTNGCFRWCHQPSKCQSKTSGLSRSETLQSALQRLFKVFLFFSVRNPSIYPSTSLSGLLVFLCPKLFKPLSNHCCSLILSLSVRNSSNHSPITVAVLSCPSLSETLKISLQPLFENLSSFSDDWIGGTND